METSFHVNSVNAVGSAPAARAVTASRVSQTSRAVEDDVAIENTRALRKALDDTPHLRDDVIKRSAALVGDVTYPPRETIRMISHLLAIQLSEGNPTDPN